VRVIGYRYQRTLAAPAEVSGVGFVGGGRVRAVFRPAPPDTGVVFRRADKPGSPPVPARVAEVTGTRRRTTLGSPAAGITLVEHLLAALSGLRIDNCVVDLDGPEPPGLDGSAAGFVAALAAAGGVLQPVRRAIRAAARPVVVSAAGATLALHPTDRPGLRISYALDYGPQAAVPRQAFTTDITPGIVAAAVAACRTFLTQPEADALRAQGVGRHLTHADLLVFGPHGPVSNRLRFADEPARHKVLDLLGDLALCGFDLAGHLVAYRSGHALNAELARQLVQAAAAESAPPGRPVVVALSSRPKLSRAA
jgi:UDP-3-O-acyl N-acetylglucosamine deacetylase